jgi:hypothetical protein
MGSKTFFCGVILGVNSARVFDPLPRKALPQNPWQSKNRCHRKKEREEREGN